jgi:hypothetical protein
MAPMAGPLVGAFGSRPLPWPEPPPQLVPPTLQIAARAVATIDDPTPGIDVTSPATSTTMHAMMPSHSTFVCPADPCRRLTRGAWQWPGAPTMGREAHLANGPA